MIKRKRIKGSIILPENKPIRTLRPPLWYGTTEKGHQRIMQEPEAHRWALQTGRPVKMRLKKYELDEL